MYKAFTPIMQRWGTEIPKVQEFYLARSGREGLLESVAIEQGVARNFFVQLKQHDATITVRLLPATDPENPRREEGDGFGGGIHPSGVPGWSLWKDSSSRVLGRGRFVSGTGRKSE